MTQTETFEPLVEWIPTDPAEAAKWRQQRADDKALTQLRQPIDDLPDPLARPLVDRETVRAELAAAQVVLYWHSPSNQWLKIPVDAAHQESWLVEYCQDMQDRYDAIWRSSPAYQRAVDQALAKQREEADERRYDRARENDRDRLRDKRTAELVEYGLNVHQARQQVEKEFGKEA